MQLSGIRDLANSIANNTATVEGYFIQNNLALPSFELDAPPKSLIPTDAINIEAARVRVIDDTLQLRRLMLGPLDYLMSFTHDELISMQAITRLGMANSFPINKQASFRQIAEKTRLSEENVRRLIRHAVVKGIFQEKHKGVVTHNAVSRLLAEIQQTADWVGASTDELWQAASQTMNALDKWPGSQEPNDTGFALANNTTLSVYEVFNRHPERARLFGSAMESFTQGTGFDVKYVIDGYPWESIANGTVVDVGGSHGFVCQALASKFPSMRLIVEDLPPVVSSAPKNVSDRVKFLDYNFFNEQPIKGADAYFFRWIFHNWSDKYSIRILQNTIPALKPGARIIINDNVLPDPGLLPAWTEERLRSMDLTMLELQNSRERELDDWANLFSLADKRFKFKGGHMEPGSFLWILEAVWNP